MRISSRAMVDHVLINLQRNFARLDRLHNQISSGKRVAFPSDDPAAAALSMRLSSALVDNDQYMRNAQAGLAWLQQTDKALQDMVQVLHRARELIIAGARGDLPPESRRALAGEMDQLIRHLVQVGNTSHAGRFLLGGFKTTQPPLQISNTDPGTGWVMEVTYSGSTSPTAEIAFEIGPQVTAAVGIPGLQVFGPPAPPPQPPNPELFQHLIDARTDLDSGDAARLSGQDLANLDGDLERVLLALDQVGARQEGLELVVHRLTAQEVSLREFLSGTEELDLARAITDLKMQENVYRLALASGARVIQPTLLDFLR